MTKEFYKGLIETIEEEPIDEPKTETKRLSLDDVLNLSVIDFQKWYIDRKKVTEKMLVDYEIFASIPQTSNHAKKNDWFMDSWTHVGDHLERTKEGLEYLKQIKEMYKKKHSSKIKIF